MRYVVASLVLALVVGCSQKHFRTVYILRSQTAELSSNYDRMNQTFSDFVFSYGIECEFSSDREGGKCLEMTGKGDYPLLYVKAVESGMRITVSALDLVFITSNDSRRHQNGQDLVEEFASTRGFYILSKETLVNDMK